MNAPAALFLSNFIGDHIEDFRQFVEANQFSRPKHKLDLSGLIRFLLFNSCDGNENGHDISLRKYFTDAKSRIGRSCLCKARQKLRWEAFEYLLTEVNCEERVDGTRWHGHHVRAIDGTRLVLPLSQELNRHFPRRHSSRGTGLEHYPRARLVTATNVVTKQVTHAVVGPYLCSERDQVMELIKQLSPEDLLLFDRGLESLELWMELALAGCYFVARVRTSDQSKKFLSSALLQTQRTQCRIERTYKGKSIRLRLVRGPRRKDGSCVVVITNLLDEAEYTRKEIINLYRKRWEAEKAFLHLKQVFNLEHFHSRKLNGVMQEVYIALVNQAWVAGWIWQAHHTAAYLNETLVISFKASAKALVKYLLSAIKGSRTAKKVQTIVDEIASIYHYKQKDRSYPRYSFQPHNRWAIAHGPSRYAQTKYRPDPQKWWRTKGK